MEIFTRIAIWLTAWTSLAGAQGFHPRQAFARLEVPHHHCVQLAGGGDLAARYAALADGLADELVRRGWEQQVTVYAPPSNGPCEDRQLNVVAYAAQFEELREWFARQSAVVRGPNEAVYLPVVSAEAEFRTLELRQALATIAERTRDMGLARVGPLIEAERRALRDPRTRAELAGAHGQVILAAFEHTYNQLRRLVEFAGWITPDGIEALMRPERDHDGGAGRRAIRKVVAEMRGFFDSPPLAGVEIYDAFAFESMIALKELEERFPLAEVVAELNLQFSLRAFDGLRGWPPEELGRPTRELLLYLLRYRPYLHPLVDLKISAILAGAGFDGSRPPAPADIRRYRALPGLVMMQPHGFGRRRLTPSVIFSREDAQIPLTAELNGDLAYLEAWFRRHRLALIDWDAVTGVSHETLAGRARQARELAITHADCEGFLVARRRP